MNNFNFTKSYDLNNSILFSKPHVNPVIDPPFNKPIDNPNPIEDKPITPVKD